MSYDNDDRFWDESIFDRLAEQDEIERSEMAERINVALEALANLIDRADAIDPDGQCGYRELAFALDQWVDTAPCLRAAQETQAHVGA